MSSENLLEIWLVEIVDMLLSTHNRCYHGWIVYSQLLQLNVYVFIIDCILRL